ncbi:MAG: DmsE family decaheme c-type cytochrome, partial [Candidatus Aminicenantes bacterium]
MTGPSERRPSMPALPKTRPHAFVLLAALLAVMALTLMAWPEKAAARQESPYAGIDQCAACHEEAVAAYRQTVHGQKGFEMRSRHACETCHGPGKAHVDAGGGKGSMTTVKGLSKEKQSAVCLTCHERGNQTEWHGSRHESRDLACQDCHSVHSPAVDKALLKEPETEMCFSCHKQKKSQFFRASHHPVREGLMTCSDCHDPHGLQEGKLVDQTAVAESCYECHAEKRGPFLWEHIPVREDCMTCHEPHGSNHMKMLKVKEPFL